MDNMCKYECLLWYYFFFSSRRRHRISKRDWSSDVCSSDLESDADVTRGLEAERGDRQWHPEIVVDALRHLHDMNAAARGEGHGAAHHVVAADRDERVDLELRQRRQRVFELLRVARDVGAR